jgi:hypothetical protein
VHTCPDAGSSTHSGISCAPPSEKCRFMFSASPRLPAPSPPPSPLPTARRAGLAASWATAEPPVASASPPLLASDARTGRRASRDTDEERRMSRTCPINAACASYISRAGPTPSMARAQPPARAGRPLQGGQPAGSSPRPAALRRTHLEDGDARDGPDEAEVKEHGVHTEATELQLRERPPQVALQRAQQRQQRQPARARPGAPPSPPCPQRRGAGEAGNRAAPGNQARALTTTPAIGQ